jgi:hypothetical protein
MDKDNLYSQIAERIIKQQESIIGPVAIEQAEHIPNLHINWAKNEVSIKANGAKVIDSLVESYKELFGKLSVEVSKEAAGNLLDKLPKGEMPKTLA